MIPLKRCTPVCLPQPSNCHFLTDVASTLTPGCFSELSYLTERSPVAEIERSSHYSIQFPSCRKPVRCIYVAVRSHGGVVVLKGLSISIVLFKLIIQCRTRKLRRRIYMIQVRPAGDDRPTRLEATVCRVIIGSLLIFQIICEQRCDRESGSLISVRHYNPRV